MSEPSGWSQPEVPSAAPEPVRQPPGGWGPPPGAPAAAAYAPRPGIIPLRPLRLGEILDGAFGAVRTNPRAILGWSAIVVVIMVVITTLTSYFLERELLSSVGSLSSLFSEEASSGGANNLLEVEKNSAGGIVGASVISLAVQLIAQALLAGVVTVSVSAGVIGRRVGGASLWERVRPRLAPLIGLSVLTTLVTFVAALVPLLPGGIVLGVGLASGSRAAEITGAVLLVVGVAAAVAVALIAAIRLLLAPPALVLEPQPVLAAMKRSWRLTRHGFWRILGIYLLVRIGLVVVAGAVGVPFTLLASAISSLVGGNAEVATRLAVTAVGTAITSTVIYPITAAIVALLYIDQRMRTEGLDVELTQAAATPA